MMTVYEEITKLRLPKRDLQKGQMASSLIIMRLEAKLLVKNAVLVWIMVASNNTLNEFWVLKCDKS